MSTHSFMLENKHASETSQSDRVIATPTKFAQNNYFYVQEVGRLKSLVPHLSKRQNLNSFLFFIVLSGEGCVTYDGQSFLLHQGGCAFIDCSRNYSHISSENAPWELMWVHFNGPRAQEFYQQFLKTAGNAVFHSISLIPYEQALSMLLHINKERSTMAELQSNKYITDIITHCILEAKQEGNPTDNSMAVKLHQVRTYIDTNYTNKISLEGLAELFFISKFHLSREFKKAYGITIGTYLSSCRMGQAKHLLRFSSKPIEEIAISCGIPDTSYFTKVFRKSEQMTALEYRRKWGAFADK